MDVISQFGPTLLVLAIIFGVFMTWGIGANDVANALGTSVGSGAITVRTAIIVAAIFEQQPDFDETVVHKHIQRMILDDDL